MKTNNNSKISLLTHKSEYSDLEMQCCELSQDRKKIFTKIYFPSKMTNSLFYLDYLTDIWQFAPNKFLVRGYVANQLSNNKFSQISFLNVQNPYNIGSIFQLSDVRHILKESLKYEKYIFRTFGNFLIYHGDELLKYVPCIPFQSKKLMKRTE